jgi:hypothetical protein
MVAVDCEVGLISGRWQWPRAGEGLPVGPKHQHTLQLRKHGDPLAQALLEWNSTPRRQGSGGDGIAHCKVGGPYDALRLLGQRSCQTCVRVLGCFHDDRTAAQHVLHLKRGHDCDQQHADDP